MRATTETARLGVSGGLRRALLGSSAGPIFLALAVVVVVSAVLSAAQLMRVATIRGAVGEDFDAPSRRFPLTVPSYSD